MIITGTNGFSCKDATHNITFQEITWSWRKDKNKIENTTQFETKKRPLEGNAWAQRSIRTCTEVPQFSTISLECTEILEPMEIEAAVDYRVSKDDEIRVCF